MLVSGLGCAKEISILNQNIFIFDEVTLKQILRNQAKPRCSREQEQAKDIYALVLQVVLERHI